MGRRPVPASPPGRPLLARAALAAAAAAIAGALLDGNRTGAGLSLVLIAVAYVALAVLVGAERRRPSLDRRLVLGVGGVLLVLAVVVPPTQSGDLWSYAMYGRMVTNHRSSPYRHVPAEYQSDPVERRVPRFWLRSKSVYGPLFTGVSVVGMAVIGDSATMTRLFFQALAALAVALSLLLVERRTRDPVALAFLVINPLTIISVVNGGHNDALVGLAVLGGVLLVTERRPGWAGAVLAAGALVKAAAVLPLAAVAVWVWWREGRRAATVLGATAAAVGLTGLVAASLPAVLGALGGAQHRVTGGSLEGALRRLLGDGMTASPWVGMAAAVGLTFLLAACRPRREGVVLAAGGAVVAYLLVGAYVVPWYLGWGLPVLALAWRWRIGWLALAQAALLQIATASPSTAPPGRLSVGDPVTRFQLDLYHGWVPLFELLALVAVVAVSVRRLLRCASDESESEVRGSGCAGGVSGPLRRTQNGEVSPGAARPPRRPGRGTDGR